MSKESGDQRVAEDVDFEDRIVKLCKLMHGASEIQVVFLRYTESGFDTHGAASQGKFSFRDIESFQAIKRLVEDSKKTVCYFGDWTSLCIGVPLWNDGNISGMIALGPETTVKVRGADRSVFQSDIYNKLFSLASICHQLVYSSDLNMDEVHFFPGLREGAQQVEADLHKTLEETRETQRFHGSREFEEKLLRHVMDGDSNALIRHINTQDPGRPGNLTSNDSERFRQEKNIFICITTLAARAAISGGVDWEVALTLADTLIQRVESIDSGVRLTKMPYLMLLEYCDLVKKARGRPQLSKPIKQSIEFIKKNLNRAISVSELSELTGYSGDHLTRLFRSEFNMSVQEYIRWERIEEAKSLLLDSNRTLAEIADALAFSSRSHFSSAFKKVAKVTPVQYRREN